MLVRIKTIFHKQPSVSFKPDYMATSVADIDFDFLIRRGIKACFIDLDGTVVSRGTHTVDPKIIAVLKRSNLPIFVATNRPRSQPLKNLLNDLSASSAVHPTGWFPKPTKHYYQRALKDLELKPEETVMIGDRYIQDVFGANHAGLQSLVVLKNGASLGPFDKALSTFEAKLTRFLTNKYSNSAKEN